jgi:predicted DNA-binding transcriptional regulator YafY
MLETSARAAPAPVAAADAARLVRGRAGRTARGLLHTGADTLETLAVYLGMLGADFEVDAPPELVAHLRDLADRYRRAIT